MSTAHSQAPSVRSNATVAALVLAVLALLLAAFALAWSVTRGDAETVGSAEGSGVAVAETRHVDPFTAVELSGSNDVTIGIGPEQRVVVYGDANLVDQVVTQVSGNVLAIDETGSFDSITPMRVEITVPSLDAVRLSGSGAMTIDGHDLSFLTVALPGSGSIVGAGSVASLDVDLAGSGDIDFGKLVARDATVDLSGVGSVLVHVTGRLEADVSGTGSITYSGEPDSVEQEITGVGSVTGE
jgi:hypothetical protein